MKLPRDLSGTQLAKHLGRVGYKVTRQTGSHIRLTIARAGPAAVLGRDVIPAKAGIHDFAGWRRWVPALAGTTIG